MQAAPLRVAGVQAAADTSLFEGGIRRLFKKKEEIRINFKQQRQRFQHHGQIPSTTTTTTSTNPPPSKKKNVKASAVKREREREEGERGIKALSSYRSDPGERQSIPKKKKKKKNHGCAPPLSFFFPPPTSVEKTRDFVISPSALPVSVPKKRERERDTERERGCQKRWRGRKRINNKKEKKEKKKRILKSQVAAFSSIKRAAEKARTQSSFRPVT